MTNDTLTHPVNSPTTTIVFNGIVDMAWGRTAMNSEDFGSHDGKSRQAASKRTKGDLQITFHLNTDATGSVRSKVKTLADLYKAQADADMKLLINFSDGGTLTIIGKVVDVRGNFEGGKGAVQFMGTIDINISIESWS